MQKEGNIDTDNQITEFTIVSKALDKQLFVKRSRINFNL